MKKLKWTEKPITWGGYATLCAICYVISMVMCLFYYIVLFERSWWTNLKESVKDISRQEHSEFCRRMETENKRLEDENDRQNHRLEILEEAIKQIASISTSIEKLALNMESMLKEQVSQGNRLEVLESRDGEMWRKMVGYILSAVVGVFLGIIFKPFA